MESESEDHEGQLKELIHDGADADAVDAYLDTITAGDAARAVSRLSEEDRGQLLTSLDPDDAADLVQELSETQAAEMLESIEPTSAASIIHELPSDEQADLLGEISETAASTILDAMDQDEAARVRQLQSYPTDVAGGLMITEYLAYPVDSTVRDVIDDLHSNAEEYRDYEVQYAYVVERDGSLLGVLPLRSLLLAKPKTAVRDLMIASPIHVSDRDGLEELEEFFDRYHFIAVPVLSDRRLVGVVMKESVEKALRDKHDDDYRKSQGIVREELRSMPLFLRSRRRLSWLSVNILLNVAAASVIAFYQDTLEAVIALAVFLPIISDMSGCSGNQAVAVSMRELSLGLVRPSEIVYVVGKEALLGIVNGLALGGLLAAVAFLWKGNASLGLVVGGALALNTLVAVIIGGSIPLILKRAGKDPALASGPILTTVTDMCGFLIVLSLASAAMEQLKGL